MDIHSRLSIGVDFMSEKTFAQKLKEERVRTGLSQIKFSERIGIPRRTIEEKLPFL